MDCSIPGLPVHDQLPEFPQAHVHGVGDANQPSPPLSPPLLPPSVLSAPPVFWPGESHGNLVAKSQTRLSDSLASCLLPKLKLLWVWGLPRALASRAGGDTEAKRARSAPGPRGAAVRHCGAATESRPPRVLRLLLGGLPAAGQVPTGLLPRPQQAGGGEAGEARHGLGLWPAPCSGFSLPQAFSLLPSWSPCRRLSTPPEEHGCC